MTLTDSTTIQPKGTRMEEFALPSKPPPTAQPAYGVPSSSLTADRLNARDDLLRKYMQGQPYVLQNGSVRSAGGSTVTADSIDLEKGILGVEMPEGREPRRSKKKHRREMSERHDERRSDRSPPVQHSHGTHEQMEEEQEILLEQKSLKLLLFLSGPLAALSLLLTLWTFLSIIFSALLQPFRLCACRPNLREQILSLLAPPLNFQLSCIYSCVEAKTFSIPILLIVHMLSPFLALGVMVWSWIVAIYWIFATMVGNPDGLDGRNDGRELVLQLRQWWENWLCKAIRERQDQ